MTYGLPSTHPLPYPTHRPIVLRTCFSINRKKDPKHNHVLALYTSPDVLNVAADSEAELNDWLGFLHHHMHQAGTGQDGHARKMYGECEREMGCIL